MLPSVSTTTGTTSAFNFHSFPNSIPKFCYFSIFSRCFTMIFWSPGLMMSMIKQLFATLSMHTISGCLCSTTLSVWIGKSHKILHLSISSTESGTCLYHLSLHSRWNLLYRSQWVFFATLSCLFWYWFFPGLGQALMMCVTVSTFSLQSRQRGVSLVLSILYFTELVLIACSCSAQRRLSVSLFSSNFLNHSHFLLSLWHSISLTNCPCSTFCLHSFNRLFFSFLITLAMYFSKLSSAPAALTRVSLLCDAYFHKLHFSSSTQSLALTRPLPPSLLGM